MTLIQGTGGGLPRPERMVSVFAALSSEPTQPVEEFQCRGGRWGWRRIRLRHALRLRQPGRGGFAHAVHLLIQFATSSDQHDARHGR